MKKLMAWKEAYLKDENGATAIEYGLIAGAISLAIAGVLVSIEGNLEGVWNAVDTQLGNANPNN